VKCGASERAHVSQELVLPALPCAKMGLCLTPFLDFHLPMGSPPFSQVAGRASTRRVHGSLSL
jgi:hypothetical protein